MSKGVTPDGLSLFLALRCIFANQGLIFTNVYFLDSFVNANQSCSYTVLCTFKNQRFPVAIVFAKISESPLLISDPAAADMDVLATQTCSVSFLRSC